MSDYNYGDEEDQENFNNNEEGDGDQENLDEHSSSEQQQQQAHAQQQHQDDHYEEEYYESPTISIQNQLHDLSLYEFPSKDNPEIDPTGRAAFRSCAERVDKDSRLTFLRFPSTSILERLDAVEEVNLSRCGLGDKGMEALSEALRVNQTITELNLSDNGITHAGLVKLCHVLETQREESKSIRKLNLAENRLSKNSSIPLSNELPSIQAMIIASQAAAMGIAGFAPNASASNNTPRGGNKNTSSPQTGNANSSSSAAPSPSAGATTNTPTTTTSATAAGAATATTTTGGTFNVTSGFANAAMLPGNASGNVADSSLLSIPGTAGYELGRLLGKNTPLEDLNLRATKLNDSDIIGLAEGLVENTTLVSLDLSQNDIGHSSAIALARILKESTIKDLNLEWNKLQDDQRTCKILFGEYGLASSDVKRLLLSWNGLGDESAREIGKVLEGSSRLEELDLSNNHIGAKGAEWLAKGVKTSTNLSVLILHDNPLRDEGCAALIMALINQESQSVNTVDMRATGAGKQSAELVPSLMDAKPSDFSLDMPREITSIEDIGNW